MSTDSDNIDVGLLSTTIGRRTLLRAGGISLGTLILSACQRAGIVPATQPAITSNEPPRSASASPTPFQVPASVPVTSNRDFYVVSSGPEDVQIDPQAWRLAVAGEIEHGSEFTLADIKQLPSVREMRTLECISNPVGGDLIGNANWQGIQFKTLLDKISLRPTAKEIVFHCAEDFSTSIPVELALNPRSLLVYEMNGQPLPSNHGGPLRAIWPGRYGMKQPKWITRIEAITGHYTGYWESQGWTNDAFIKVNSQITTPIDGATALLGKVYIAGRAHAGDAGVDKVEVSTDEGKTWNLAQLVRGPDQYVYTVWYYEWDAPTPVDAAIQVRATDRNGMTQSKRAVSFLDETFPTGANGIQQVTVHIAKG